MRWDNLFDDLESQLESGIDAEELDLRAEEERLRLGRLTLRDRIAALHRAGDAGPVRVRLRDGSVLPLTVTALGKDWIAADVAGAVSRRSCVAPLSGIVGLSLSAAQVAVSLVDAGAEPPGSLSARLGLPFVLRDLCRRRVAVDVECATGALHGTIDRVGRDHLDLAVHERGVPRRGRDVTDHALVVLDQVQLVRFG